MKVKNKVVFYLITLTLMLAITIFASACSCGEKYKEIKVFYNGEELTAQNNSINIPADAPFTTTTDITVYGCTPNGILEELNLDLGDYELSVEPLLTKPISAGHYEIIIKCDNKEVKIPLNIRNSDDTITLQKNSSKVYDGEPASEPEYITKSNNTATATWYTANKEELLDEIPINAGSYVCVLTTSTTNRFTGTTLDVPFEITKADCTPTSAHAELNITYNKTTTLSTIELEDCYYWQNGDIVPTCDRLTYPALYNPDKRNYNDCEVDLIIHVTPATLSEPVADATEYIYTAEPQTYNLEQSDLYTIIGATQTNCNVNDQLEVIPYVVTVQLNDKTNYIWLTSQTTEDLTYDFVINKAVPQIEAIKRSAVYGDALSVVTETLPEGFSWPDDPQYPIPDILTDIGTYNLTALYTPEDLINYTTTYVTVEIYVNEALIVPDVLDIELIYNGSEQNAPLNENFIESKMEIVSGYTYTNAGSYQVVIKLKDNYLWEDRTTDNKTVNWEIKKAKITLSAKDSGAYSSDNLVTEYDGNYIASDFEVLTDLTTELPFTILYDSVPLVDTSSLTFNMKTNTDHFGNGGFYLYSDVGLQDTTTSIGRAYVGVVYELAPNNNYILGNNNTYLLIYSVSIVAQTYKQLGTLGIAYTNYDETLASISIDSSRVTVYINMAQSPGSIIYDRLPIEGSWAWEDDGSTTVMPKDVVKAIFTPIVSNPSYTGTVEQNVTLEIEIPDTITAWIRADNEIEKTQVAKDENSNDRFSLTITDILQPYYVSFALPNGCTFEYTISGPNVNNTFTYMRNDEIIVPQTNGGYIYNNETYVITLRVSGGLSVTKIFTINFVQDYTTIYISGTEWDGSSNVGYKDIIYVPMVNSQSLYDEIRIKHDVQTNNEYTVALEDNNDYISIEYLKDSAIVFNYALPVSFTRAFNSVTLNQTNKNIIENNQNFVYQLDLGEDTLNITLNNAVDNINNLIVAYSINNEEYTTLTAGIYHIDNIPTTTLVTISIIVKTSADVDITTLNITFKQYTRLTQVTYTMANGEQLNSIEDIVLLPCFLTNISAQARDSSMVLEITNNGSNTLTFGPITSATQNYIIKVFDNNETLLETKYITVKYDIDVYISREDSILTTANSSTGLNALVPYSDNLDVNLSADSDLTLIIYTTEERNTSLSVNTINIPNGETSITYYARILYDATYYLDMPFTLLKTTNINLYDIFTSLFITTSETMDLQPLELDANSVTTLEIPVIISINSFLENLNYNAFPNYIIDNTRYNVYAEYDANESASLVTINIIDNDTSEWLFLYTNIVLVGSLDGNVSVDCFVHDENGDEKENCWEINESLLTINITNLANEDRIYFETRNDLATVELYDSNNVLIYSDLHAIFFRYAGNKQYTLKVIATNGTIANYTLTTNGTFVNTISVTINSVDYNTYYNEKGEFVGFFSQEDNNYTGQLPTTAISDFDQQTTVTATITLINSAIPIYDENTILVTGAHAFAIHPADATYPAYITFYIQNPENPSIKAYFTIYFIAY